MAGRKAISVRAAVLDYLSTHRPEIVDRETFRKIRFHVGALTRRPKPPSSAYLLDILLRTDTPVDRTIGGIPLDLRGRVLIDDLAQAKSSLLDMAREYENAPSIQRATDVRRAVLRTKNHLKLALSRTVSPGKRAAKQEIYQWLLVWLENPGIFESWVALRRTKDSTTK